VVREALSNTARHAAASGVLVQLRASATQVTVEVADDGRGMGDPARRSGLENLRSRAARRGGRMAVDEPPPDRGTRVLWSVPLS